MLSEVHPFTDLFQTRWTGQDDPLYAVVSRFIAGRSHVNLGSDNGWKWTTGHGEGFFMDLSNGEQAALCRAAREALADPDLGTDENSENEYDCAIWYLYECPWATGKAQAPNEEETEEE